VNQYWNSIGTGGMCKVMLFSEFAPAVVSDSWIGDT